MFVEKIRNCFIVFCHFPSYTKDYVDNVFTLVKSIITNNLDVKINVVIGNDTNFNFENDYKIVRININFEHTLVKKGGRSVPSNTPEGKITYNNGNEKYLVRIDNYNKLMESDIIIDYSVPNIRNVAESALFDEFSNKHIYIAPNIYNSFNINPSNRNINILTTFINTQEPRRQALLEDMKNRNLSNVNVNNCFEKDKLQSLYKNTKLLINIHQTNEHNTFEELRVLPALENGVIVVCEKSPLMEVVPYKNLVIWCEYNEIISTTTKILENYEENHKKIFNYKNKTIIDELAVTNYNTLIKKLIDYKPPTFNVVITTIGRNCLLHMLKSLQPQLTNADCLTIIFDGYEPNKEIFDIKFKCRVIIIRQKENLGMKRIKMMYRERGEYQGVGIGGHAVKEAFKGILEKRDFIMHSDDDDEYFPGVFDDLRRKCINKNFLYIGNAALERNKGDIIPRNKNVNGMFHIFDEGNITSQSGIIPYELNRKGIWGQIPSGDCEFYRSLFNIVPRIVILDTLIYQFTPHKSLKELAIKYSLDKSIHTGCHNYIPGYTKLFRDIRYSVKNLLEIGIGSIENNQMGGINGYVSTRYGYKTGNSLKCWSEYFIYSKIYGVDIYKHEELNTDVITTYVADQSSERELQKVVDNINSEIDVIIDDGSHICKHQVISFMFLHKFLKSGGIYVIEDVQPDSIELMKDLSAFPSSFKEYILDNFTVEYFDTRDGINRRDDFMVAFKKN